MYSFVSNIADACSVTRGCRNIVSLNCSNNFETNMKFYKSVCRNLLKIDVLIITGEINNVTAEQVYELKQFRHADRVLIQEHCSTSEMRYYLDHDVDDISVVDDYVDTEDNDGVEINYVDGVDDVDDVDEVDEHVDDVDDEHVDDVDDDNAEPNYDAAPAA